MHPSPPPTAVGAEAARAAPRGAAPAPREPSWLSGWPALAVLAVLLLAAALPYAVATPLADATRDLLEAWRIASGEAWPLRGPRINEMAHLGPAWFYLLAAPMALTGSVAATLLFIGLLAGLKLPLAWACGRCLLGPRFGLLWALAVALPGWSLLSGVLVTHTSLVETCVLAVLWCALRLRTGAHAAWWIALGLAAGAALHAHPATLVLAPLLLALLPARRWSPAEVMALLGGVLAAAAWFVPMLAAEWRSGWPMLQATADYAASAQAGGLSMEGLPRLVAGTVLGAPWLLATHIASGMDAVVQVLGHGLLAVLALAGTRAVAGAGPLRRPALLALLALALGWTGLLLLRATTPFYMVLMLGPALALLLALALEGLARAGRPRATAVAAVAMVLLALLANARLLQRALHGAMDFSPAAVLDVRHWHLPGGPVALFPAWQQDRLGALQCASAAMHRIDILHGELAVLGDAALVLPARLRCGTPRHLGVGGGADVPGARHRLGLTPAMLQQLGHGGVDWSQALQLAPTAVIGAGAPLAVPDGSIYPPRPLGLGQAREHVFQVQLPGGAVVLVGQLFALYGGSTEGVNANGLPMAPVARSSSVAAFRCDACGAGPVQWQLRLRTGFPERIDIVAWEP